MIDGNARQASIATWEIDMADELSELHSLDEVDRIGGWMESFPEPLAEPNDRGLPGVL